MTKQEWEKSAYLALVSFARLARKPFTIDEAREKIGEKVEPPCDLRWWGAVTRLAIVRGIIVRLDFAPSVVKWLTKTKVYQMPNAFSKDYQPVVDLTQDSIKNEMSRKRSMMRKDKLDSDDPAVREMAAGTLGRLSGIRENKAILKNSKLG